MTITKARLQRGLKKVTKKALSAMHTVVEFISFPSGQFTTLAIVNPPDENFDKYQNCAIAFRISDLVSYNAMGYSVRVCLP